jgi:hypothetical protein
MTIYGAVAPRAKRRSWSSVVPLVAAALALVGQHAALIGYKTYANVDEAYASAIAARLLGGAKLYEGAISQRGPLMYYVYELICGLVGWDNVMGLRVIALLFAVLEVLVVVWAARRTLARVPAVTAGLVMTYALAFGLPAIDGIALHGESLQVPVLMMSFVFGAEAMRKTGRAQTWKLVLAGVTVGAAICIKQSAALHPLPLALFILVRNRYRLARAARMLGVYTAATLLLPGVFVLHAWLNGTLRSLVYYTWTYNRLVHLRPTSNDGKNPWLAPLIDQLYHQRAFVLCVLFVASFVAIYLWRRVPKGPRALLRGFGVPHYLAAHLGIALFSGAALVRFFPHYFLPATGFLAVAVAGGAGQIAPLRLRARIAGPLALSASAFLLLSGAIAGYVGEKIDGRVTESKAVKQTARYIEAATLPTDRIFVWGFSPSLYGYSHRRPAGRFVFETYPTGFVPWYWEDLASEPARVVPGSMEALLGDLESEKPALVVDAGQAMIARSMRAYPQAASYLHEHYCFELRVSVYDIYRRMTPGVPCASAVFPKLHAPEDYFGNDLMVKAPGAVDDAQAVKLPFEDESLPQFFGAPPPACQAARDERLEQEERDRAKVTGRDMPLGCAPYKLP